MRAGDEIHAGGHHRGGMDQGGHRRGTGHRVRQPGLERHLRGLADGAAEQQQRNDRHRRRAVRPQLAGAGHGGLHLDRAHLAEQEEQAEQHGGVADAGHHERLARGVAVLRLLVEEADQQVAAEPDALPAEEQHQQVVAEHQHEHREHEQVHVGEEPAVALFVPHVAGRVEVDEEADAGDDAGHHEGQAVEVEPDARREAADLHPRPQEVGGRFGARGVVVHADHQRDERRQADGARRPTMPQNHLRGRSSETKSPATSSTRKPARGSVGDEPEEVHGASLASPVTRSARLRCRCRGSRTGARAAGRARGRPRPRRRPGPGST